MSNLKSVTVRFPEEVFEAARAMKGGGESFNSFVVDSVQARLRAIEEKLWYDSFTILGQGKGSDVDFALEAQREVILEND